ncbi:hypothetical protein HBH82_245380 [Parastagonospora nodorum]|nr:hypothetical protein HBH82_245380 [Parastagonospora nodorum]KAH4658641.1 hypothetical protein HBH78_239550 [Parastagonospora nodorum]KAH4691460.1 hypothetical protein HBH67_244220 [Parastagonospora nodorum]KAH4751420.1 hypothetical protein HBH63_242140 [Parastagonospora nodorum]KAH4775938.1 hypothetical protein HBH62_176660 [Parastagonospora nodorum]
MCNLMPTSLTKARSSKSVYAVFECLASSSNLSTTTRCANSSGLSQSSSRNYPSYNSFASLTEPFLPANANVVSLIPVY